MKIHSAVRSLCIAACLVTSTLVTSALAAAADPPARVGRLSYVAGDVSVFNDSEEGWERAQVNLPVTSENSLWTRANARAEIRIGPSAIRLDDETIFDMVTLEDDLALGFLQRGTISVRLRRFGTPEAADALSVDTQVGRFTLDTNGRYRIDASADGEETRITVFSGRARFDGGDDGGTRLTVDAGKTLTARGGGAASEFRFEAAREAPFDQWAENRDADWDRAHTRYARDNTVISPYMTGYEELDIHGEWIDEPEYGRLWAPRVVSAEWAPYRYGRWAYVRPWGYTWVDDSPWGFAPFHYGRWVQVRSRWHWWPGPYQRRPVYAPALVAWIGGPAHGVGQIRGGAVGWFPLAPREHYVPGYSRNVNYHRRLNYLPGNGNVTPPSRYRNHVPGATVVANEIFANGNPVNRHVSRLNPGTIAGQPPRAAIDLPRPTRQAHADLPDRRQGDRRNQPRPHFVDNPPSRRAPGEGPRFRTPEPTTAGPLPVPRAAPSLPGQSGQPSAPLPPVQGPRGRDRGDRGGQPSAPQPQVQQQPQPVTPAAQPGGVAVPDPRTVETNPAFQDRDNRSPRQRNRPPQAQPQPAQPQPAQPQAPVVIPAPQVRPIAPAPMPHAGVPRPPVAAPVPQVDTRPQAQPRPKPDRDDNDNRGDSRANDNRGDSRSDGRSGRPRTNKD